MTVDGFLRSAGKTLLDAGITTGRLDCLVLLEDCLGKDRAYLLAHTDTVLSIEQEKTLREHIERRVLHVPLAYIRGKTEFYGREFMINDFVLEPRPESEMMIDQLKQLAVTKDTTIIDVGCGSGALAITAKLELPAVQVFAVDIDERCVALTRQNAKVLHAAIEIIHGDLLTPFTTTPAASILLCNLPYVPDGFHINQAATHEPRIAIFGGPDGLDLYRKLFTQVSNMTNRPTYILTEALPPQHDELTEIAEQYGYTQLGRDDFIQVFQPAHQRQLP